MRGMPLPTLLLFGLLAACGESARVGDQNVDDANVTAGNTPTTSPANTSPEIQRASPTPGASAGVPPPDAGTPAEFADPGAAGDPSVPGEATVGVTSRYACDSDHRVDIVRGEVARVTLADGRVIHLRRSEETPQRYRGEALSFEVRADGATLGQDEVGGFECRLQE